MFTQISYDRLSPHIQHVTTSLVRFVFLFYDYQEKNLLSSICTHFSRGENETCLNIHDNLIFLSNRITWSKEKLFRYANVSSLIFFWEMILFIFLIVFFVYLQMKFLMLSKWSGCLDLFWIPQPSMFRLAQLCKLMLQWLGELNRRTLESPNRGCCLRESSGCLFAQTIIKIHVHVYPCVVMTNDAFGFCLTLLVTNHS